MFCLRLYWRSITAVIHHPGNGGLTNVVVPDSVEVCGTRASARTSGRATTSVHV
jgi:hypothetical protein